MLKVLQGAGRREGRREGRDRRKGGMGWKDRREGSEGRIGGKDYRSGVLFLFVFSLFLRQFGAFSVV